MSVHAELTGDVLVVRLENPPVNSLSFGLRRALLGALERAEAESQVRGVLLTGSNGVFCAGADLRALGTPEYWSYPRTSELADVMDGMSKPVVGAIDGLAMGGGLELAMGCHWRVATAGAQLALPEARIGLLPAGGGTVRLPRLIGVQAATAMMLGCESVDGRRAHQLGLVDQLVGLDPFNEALAFTRALISGRRPLRRARDLAMHLDDPQAWFADQRRGLNDAGVEGPAARMILDCLEAGFRAPPEEAMQVAVDALRTLIDSPESKALRYLFFAERLAGKLPEVAGQERLRIERVALLGGDAQANELEAMMRGSKLKISSDEPQLVVVTRLSLETQAQLGALHAGLPASVPFATTGGFGEWQRLHELLPSRTVLGMRFSTGRTVELAREAQADPVMVDAAARLVRRLGKLVVPCTPAPGFIVERMQAAGALAMAAQGQALLDEGVAVRASDIDVALVAAGAFPAIRGGPMFSAAAAAAG
jgi:enoyl-CoA hydratase/carnithine racemase